MTASRRLILPGFYAAYIVSVMYLLFASTSKTALPAWGGYADAGLALVIAFLGFAIFEQGRGKPHYQTGHRAALNIVPVLLLGMWVLRPLFNFDILLPGLAWRVFFFLHILPYGAALRHPGTVNE
jgi:hypothetical protein